MVDVRRKSGTRPARRGALVAVVVVLVAAAGRSEADFGFGFGFQNNAYQDTQFTHAWSLQNAAAAAANRPQALVAPKFQVRDEGFMDRYDLATRESMVNRIARNPGREMSTVSPRGVQATTAAARTPAPVPAPRPVAAPEPKPVFLLANFFDQERRMIWPSIAPITGNMGKKQEIADQAVLAVLNEYELQGLARISNVTEAREKLLAYGRPALDHVRKQTTTAIADSFHSFLLGLYTNVGLAATLPRAR